MHPADTPLTFKGLIELVFTKLQVRYGAAWLRQWEGVDMRMVKSDWEQELSGFARNPAPLLHALTILPERVPNVKQFRDLANQAPLPVAPRLARPAANQAVVARSKAKLAGIKEAMAEGAADPLRPWLALKARHEAGERLTPFQIAGYRQVLARKAISEETP